MKRAYAVIAVGDQQPTALFVALEDALVFGNQRFGPGAFRTEKVFTRALPASRPGSRAAV